MPKLPRLTAKQVQELIHARGFVLVRQSGSHIIFRNSENIRITLPFHAGKILHPKILKCILLDAKISIEEIL